MTITPQRTTRRALLATLLMGASAAGTVALTPTKKLSSVYGRLSLETAIPTQFGSWREDKTVVNGVVNPQTQALLNATYSQILSRIYLDNTGQRIMLSIAYGEDQTDTGVELHQPEVCYPAQGFQLHSKRLDVLHTPLGNIPVKRLETSYSRQRFEPVTYWVVIGNRVALGGLDKKLAELSLGLRGQIADGLVFRVSTIDTDTKRAFAAQDGFVSELVATLAPAHRARLAGLS